MTMQPHLGRLPKGEDLFHSLNAFCKQAGVNRGFVSVIGAVERAVLGYYHQDERQYESFEFDEHMEIVSCIGNVSIKDGEPFCHVHLTLSRKDCTVVAGHCMPGAVIFAAEAAVIPIPGPNLVRGFDEPTGLPLWT